MKDYKSYFIVPAEPELVYQALTRAETIKLWTGEPATMEPVEGSEFSLFDGSIEGVNISFEEGKKIVQEWFFGEQEDPSIVTIILHPHAKGTSVEVRHTNIPEEAYDNITDGWQHTYFAALIDFYEA
jgi:uncharacterized protein YndB with AHSA1/START domain